MKLRQITAYALCTLIAGSAALTANADSSPAAKASEKKVKVKYVCHYDIKEGNEYAVKLFGEKYGGELDWRPTTYDRRYEDVLTYIMGGEGIDFYPYDDGALPRGIICGYFQPVDRYINTDSKLWRKNAEVMEAFSFGGKHYNLVTKVTAENVVLYNKDTFRELGLKDPYKLWKEGKWNWDTFRTYLRKYVDEDNGRYGLDGWFFDNALYRSAGKPAVSVSDGRLVSNAESKKFTKAMEFGYGLYKDGFIADKEKFMWTAHPEYIGEGKELFYISGSWTIKGDPDTWIINTSPEDTGMVPVPSPKGSANYMGVTVDGLCLLKGADDPKGAARFAECLIHGNYDKAGIAEKDRLYKEKYGWTNALIKAEKEINAAAVRNPVIDLSYGVSDDVENYVNNASDGVRSPFYGTEWNKIKDDTAKGLSSSLKDANKKLSEAVKGK